MAEFVAAQASVLMVPTLGKGANSFQSKLKASLETVKASVEVQVKAQTDKMLAEIEAAKKEAELTPIKIRVDDRGVQKSITEIRHEYSSLSNDFRKGLTVNVAVVGLSQLTQLGPALASLNTAIVQLSQSSLVLPGIMSGIASSVGAAFVGTRGLTDAFKAQSAAQKDNANAARSQADANRSVQEATEGLNRAVKDAKRNLEDLNDQMRDAPLDTAEAMMNLQEAQAEAANKFGKTLFEQQKDLIRVGKAQNELNKTNERGIRVGQDLAEANAKGVNGADNVTSALDRLTKAQETASKGTAATRALSDAMGKLSTNGKDFVESTKSLSGAWTDLKNTTQDKLFAGLGDDLKSLAASDLPTVKDGLNGIAGAINGNLKTAMGSLGNDSSKNLLSRIFGDTASAQKNLSSGLNPLIDGFLRLSAVGGDTLPRLGTGVGVLMERFDKFVTKAEGDGSLEKWMDNGIKSADQLGNSIVNMGKVLNGVSDIFTAGGGRSMLQLLQDGTNHLNTFVHSTDGNTKLTNFFHNARVELEGWKPVLKDIPGILHNLSDASHEWSDMLMPFLKEAGDLLKNHPALVQAILYAYLSWKTITPVISGISTALNAMGGGLNILTTNLGGTKAETNNLKDAFGNFKETAGENGATGTVRKLATALGPSLLLGAATVLVTYMAGEFVSGMGEGDKALQRQKTAADELKSSLDQVTGAATNASQAMVLGKLQDGKNLATNESFGNQLTQIQGAHVDTKALSGAVASGDSGRVSQLLSSVPGATAASVEATQFWKDRHDAITKGGLSSDDIAKAINGDPDAVKKYTDWWDNTQNEALRPFSFSINPHLSHSTLQGMQKTGLTDDTTPDLLQFKQQLPGDVQQQANIRGTIQQQLSSAQQGRSALGQANTAQYGALSLNNAGKSLFGPDATVNGAADGVSITVTHPLSPQLVKDIEANGGRVVGPGQGPDSPLSGSIVHLSPDRAKNYVGGFAGGGFLSGAGTGTSDSMLASVSNGEFITKAASVAKYGPDFMHALNEGKIPPPWAPWDNQGDGPGNFNPNMRIDTSTATSTGPDWIEDGTPRIPGSFTPGFSGGGPVIPPVGGSASGSASTAPPPIIPGGTPAPSFWDNLPGGISQTFSDLGGIAVNGAKDVGHWFGTILPNQLGMDPIGAPRPGFGKMQIAGGPNVQPPHSPFQGVGGNDGGPRASDLAAGLGIAPPKGAWFSSPAGGTGSKYAGNPWLGTGTPHLPGGRVSAPGPSQHMPVDASPGPGNRGAVSAPAVAGTAAGVPVFTPPGGGVPGFAPGGGGFPGIPGMGMPGIGGGAGGFPINPLNIGEQLGQIFLQLIGGFLGIDFSQITQVLGGIFGGFGGGKGGGGKGGLGGLFGPQADPAVSALASGANPYNVGVSGVNMPGASVTYTAAEMASLGIPPLFNNPGDGSNPQIPSWVQSFVQQYGGPSLVAGSTPHGSLHGNTGMNGYAVDVTGTPQDMDNFAAFLLTQPGLSAQMIHQSASGKPMGVAGGADVSGSYYTTAGGTYGDEGTMVHWAPSFRPGTDTGTLPPVGASTAGAAYGTPGTPNWDATHLGEAGSWDANTGNGFYGGLQFTQSSWEAAGGTKYAARADLATEDQQKDIANTLYAMQGPGAWPNTFKSFASGGQLSGAGTGMSDSMLARVSNGEFITRASSVNKYGTDFMHALNQGKIDPGALPGFDGGNVVTIPGLTTPAAAPNGSAPATGQYGQAQGQLPDPSQTPSAMQAPGAIPQTDNLSGEDSPSGQNGTTGPAGGIDLGPNSGQSISNAIAGAASPKGGGGFQMGSSSPAAPGASGPAGSKAQQDPRSILGAAPKNLDHNLPALTTGIQGAAGTIGSLASMAASAALSAGTMGAGAAAAGPTSAGIQAGAQMAGQIGTDAVNILSSLLVGTATPGTTQNPYGAPVLPQGPPQSGGGGPGIVNNYGDIHTANYDEFYKGQQRREAQQQAPIMPMR